jgi:hypothetical protein
MLVASASPNHGAPRQDLWDLVRVFEGEWTGTAEGRFGSGTVHRSYAFVLNGTYLQEKNTTVYAPQDDNETGEVHDHWSFFSFDEARGVLVLRQLHDEGIVNQFVLSHELTEGNRFAFDSEYIENFTDGWRAREMYTMLSTDEFVEEFYLASPGGEWELFVRNRLKRKS